MDFLTGLSGFTGALGTAYNLFTNKRDFDYQKALQQQIFEREDTAVQRRMADLEAAGLNPNLAAGSAAGAGAAVTRSQTNDVNVGNALDMIQAANQIKLQRQEVQNKRLEAQILNHQERQADMASQKMEWQNTLDLANTLNQLGIPISIETYPTGQDTFWFRIKSDQNEKHQYNPKFADLFDYQMNSAKNSAALLEKDLDFYDANQIAGMLGGLIRLLK